MLTYHPCGMTVRTRHYRRTTGCTPYYLMYGLCFCIGLQETLGLVAACTLSSALRRLAFVGCHGRVGNGVANGGEALQPGVRQQKHV